mmetsp:Transcript_22687/g.52438  ORF Transcript_22687/g.52438 Transcript_22687/m.52438 type:complete len:263 (-) Transcript_22687:319-1107(-)
MMGARIGRDQHIHAVLMVHVDHFRDTVLFLLLHFLVNLLDEFVWRISKNVIGPNGGKLTIIKIVVVVVIMILPICMRVVENLTNVFFNQGHVAGVVVVVTAFDLDIVIRFFPDRGGIPLGVPVLVFTVVADMGPVDIVEGDIGGLVDSMDRDVDCMDRNVDQMLDTLDRDIDGMDRSDLDGMTDRLVGIVKGIFGLVHHLFDFVDHTVIGMNDLIANVIPPTPGTLQFLWTGRRWWPLVGSHVGLVLHGSTFHLDGRRRWCW